MSKIYTLDGRFTDNILVLGQTGCGKTTFLQNLARNKMFNRLKSVNWISEITLTKNREEQISLCFKNTKVNFSYQNYLNEFDALIENFQRETDDIDNNNDNNVDEILGEKKIDKLIVMDDVLGLANKSNQITLAIFLWFRESLVTIALIFVIFYTCQRQIGNWYFLRLKFSTYPQDLFIFLVFLKFCLQILTMKLLITYRQEIFGSTDFISKFRIQEKEFVCLSTVEILICQALQRIEGMLKMLLNNLLF